MKLFNTIAAAAVIGASFIAANPADAQLDRQFNNQEKISNCDKSNAQFATLLADGRVMEYICVFGNRLYNRNVRYVNGKQAGYYGLNRTSTELNKQSVGKSHFGRLYSITIYKIESEGIIKYGCVTDNGVSCSSPIKREVIHQRL